MDGALVTLGLGISCPEGAILVVDSARSTYYPDGSEGVDVVDDKMLLLGGRMAAVHQGCSPAERSIVKLAEYYDDFETAARLIFAHLSEAHYAESVPAQYRTDDHHAIVAGVGRAGEPVQLTYLRSGRQPVYAPLLEGAMFVAGESQAWRGGGDLIECADKAVRVATKLMLERIDRAKRLDRVSPVAWPLRLATVTPWGVELEDVTEADAMTWCARLEGGSKWDAVVAAQRA